LPFAETILVHALAIGLRVAGLMTFAPFWGSTAVNPRLKAVLIVVIVAILYPVCDVPAFSLTPAALVRVALSEAMLGLAIGLCLQFVLESAQVAGQLAGFQFAFSLVNIIDPQTNVDTPVLAIFHQLIALVLLLEMNVHHWLLRGIVKSFEYVPVGSVSISLPTVKELFHAAGGMWLAGLQIALPLLLATLSIDLTVGFLSKAAPQLPVLTLSIPLKSLAGYAVLAICVALWPGIFEKQFALALGWSERVMHLAH
jgi:flagellar biosynthetic protein FliR